MAASHWQDVRDQTNAARAALEAATALLTMTAKDPGSRALDAALNGATASVQALREQLAQQRAALHSVVQAAARSDSGR